MFHGGVAQVSPRHLGAALAVAFCAHLAVAVALFWQDKVQSGAPDFGIGGIEVGLGAAGGAPGSVAREQSLDDAEVVEPSPVAEEVADSPGEIAETLPETLQEPEPSAAEMIEAVESEVAAEEVMQEAPLEPVTTVTDAAEIAADAPEEVEPQVVETVTALPEAEPVKPTPQEAVAQKIPEPPQAKPVPPREPERVVRKPAEPRETPAPEAEPVQEKANLAEAPREAVERGERPKQEASVAGSNGRSGSENQAESGSGETSAGGRPGLSADYHTLIQAWLEKHKKYPRRARRRRQEGVAFLTFTIDREGRVLDYRITKSSGYDLLDDEVAAMIERANPLPKAPESMQRARLELVVPVNFSLR